MSTSPLEEKQAMTVSPVLTEDHEARLREIAGELPEPLRSRSKIVSALAYAFRCGRQEHERALSGEGILTVGTRVRWTSQAAGTSKTKVGVIVEVVPRMKPCSEASRRLLDGAGSRIRSEESYIVSVPRSPGSTASKYYWPRSSALTKMAR